MVGLQRCPKEAQPITGTGMGTKLLSTCIWLGKILLPTSKGFTNQHWGRKKKSPFHLTLLCARHVFSFFCTVSERLVFERAPPAAEQERKQLSSPCKVVVERLTDARDLKNLSEKTWHRLSSACCISPPGSPQLQGLTPLCTTLRTCYDRSNADSSATTFCCKYVFPG